MPLCQMNRNLVGSILYKDCSCLLTDRDEMSNLYRGHAIDASYQVSVHFAKQFQRRRFSKIGESETRIAYGGHVCSSIKIAHFVPIR
jgi:hypothetical protein